MKSKKTSKKLVLNKTMISALNIQQLEDVKGAGQMTKRVCNTVGDMCYTGVICETGNSCIVFCHYANTAFC